MNTLNLVSILLPGLFTFIIGTAISFPVSRWLYNNQIWKKKNVTLAIDGSPATITAKLHNDEKRKVPRMGGIIIWGSVFITACMLYLLGKFGGNEFLQKLNFTSRSQTWLPLFTLVFGGILGAIDDLSVVDYFKKKGSYIGGGLSLKARLVFVTLISFFAAYWLVFKLDIISIQIPFYGSYIMPVFVAFALVIIIMVATYASSIIDGVDGLSGGVLMAIFSAYGLIALIRDQLDIAALCLTIVAGILSFLWFNISPAKFFNGETGMTSLLLTVVIIAYLVDGVAYLPIIGFLLYVTVASVIIQLLSKKFRKKKVFLAAPIHHHFEAIGWPSHKVAMRYWIVTYFCAVFGVMLSLV